MGFRRKRNGEGDERLEAELEPEAGRGDEPGDDAPAGEESPEELRRQRDEYLEAFQRARADYQNLRRRGLADMEAAARRAKEGLMHELLLVLDYLEMALAAETRTDEGKNLLVGVRMTRDQLLGVLEREGVRAVPDGGEFDPNVHQAVATVETDEVEPGRVVETVRRGYMLGDHALRHAHVKVAAGPDEDAPEAPAGGERDAGEPRQAGPAPGAANEGEDEGERPREE